MGKHGVQAAALSHVMESGSPEAPVQHFRAGMAAQVVLVGCIMELLRHWQAAMLLYIQTHL